MVERQESCGDMHAAMPEAPHKSILLTNNVSGSGDGPLRAIEFMKQINNSPEMGPYMPNELENINLAGVERVYMLSGDGGIFRYLQFLRKRQDPSLEDLEILLLGGGTQNILYRDMHKQETPVTVEDINTGEKLRTIPVYPGKISPPEGEDDMLFAVNIAFGKMVQRWEQKHELYRKYMSPQISKKLAGLCAFVRAFPKDIDLTMGFLQKDSSLGVPYWQEVQNDELLMAELEGTSAQRLAHLARATFCWHMNLSVPKGLFHTYTTTKYVSDELGVVADGELIRTSDGTIFTRDDEPISIAAVDWEPHPSIT
jgi:hypothetical protein